MAPPFDPRIKLRHISCFLEVTRVRSVAKAAALLGITQPAVSKTISELEQTLGVALFDRSRRSLALTTSGEIFLRYASAGLTALRQGINSIAEDPAEPVLVTVGALPTVSARILPPAIERFLAKRLSARVRIVTGPNAYLLSLLRLGDVDFVVGRMAEPEAMIGLTFEHLYSERIVLAVRAGHPLLASDPFDMALIEPYHIVMPPPDAVIRPMAERLLIANGVRRLRDEVESVSDVFGRSFTRSSDAIWIISHGVVAEDVDNGFLALLPFDSSETLGPVGLTSRVDTASSVPTQVLHQIIRDVVAERA